MRPHPALASGRTQDALVVGLSGLVVVGTVTLGAEGPAPYLVVALPILVAVSWWRPACGFAVLLGVVLLTEQYADIFAAGIEPFLLQVLPLFENLEDWTPLSFVYLNLVELWLLLLVGTWFVRSVAHGERVRRPLLCPVAWLAAAGAVAATFVGGIVTGGDVKIALWEVRALGYLFGLAWLVPRLLERRSDLVMLLWVLVAGLGAKALQGLYRYFVVLRMQMDLNDTFLAHEDPVLFIPVFFLLVGLVHYRVEPRLTRVLAVAAPVMLAALALTQRRVAYVSLVFCGACFAAILVPAARRTYGKVAVPAALAGVLYVVVFYGSPSPLAQPIERALLLFDDRNESNHYRVVEYENLKYTIDVHPWGVGFGQPFEMPRDLPKTWVFYDYIPHNEILWVWVKAGTLGFILVMYYFARLLAEAVWAHRHLRDPLYRALAAAVAVAVLNQLLVAYYELQLTYARNMVYLGTLVGLLAAARHWDTLAPRLRGGRVPWR